MIPQRLLSPPLSSKMPGQIQMGCCVFLRLPSLRGGYHALPAASATGCYDSDEESAVTVLVGKDRREFLVDPFILETAPFRVLMEMASDRPQAGKRTRQRRGGDDVIFINVDAILFEHMLWLVYNDSSFFSTANSPSSSLLQLNLKEIIEFYSQDW